MFGGQWALIGSHGCHWARCPDMKHTLWPKAVYCQTLSDGQTPETERPARAGNRDRWPESIGLECTCDYRHFQKRGVDRNWDARCMHVHQLFEEGKNESEAVSPKLSKSKRGRCPVGPVLCRAGAVALG